MKTRSLLAAAAAASLLTVPGNAQTVRVVNFDGTAGTYVTANQNLRGTSPSPIAADLNGDGINDSYVQYPFSATTPLSPTSGYAGPRFFGGIRGEALHTAAGQANIAFGERGVINNVSGADAFGVRYQVDAPRTGRLWLLVYFDKTDFLNGGMNQPVKLDWKSRLSVGPFPRFESLGVVRWVIRDGTQFFVSQATLSGNSTSTAQLQFSRNEDDGRWAPYDPATSLNFDAGSAVWETRNFQDVTAVGLLVDKDGFTTARSWLQFIRFQVDAYVGPGDGTPNLPPVPSFGFTLTPASGRAPVTAAFNATATTDPEGDTLTYAWDFGDGTTGTGATVSHVYPTPGTYVVSLTVTDSYGNSAAATPQTVVVRPPNVAPVATASAAPLRGDAPLAVDFSAAGSYDPDGTITSYSWTFGDGEAGSGPNPSHVYLMPGRYLARLTVTDDEGATATSADVTIDATVNGTLPPIAVIATDLASGYAPLTVDLNGLGSYDLDGTVTAYHWSFGDGTAATGPQVTHTWTAEGTYLVTLTVTDDVGVTGTTTTQIQVGPPKFLAETEGHVRLPGSFMVRQLSGVFTLKTGGVGLRADSGQYFFLYQPLRGDGEFSARIAGFGSDDHPWASAGVMMMGAPEYGAPFIAGTVTKEKGVFAYTRPAAGMNKATVAFPGAAPLYLKVSRTGSHFAVSGSIDGQTWEPMASMTANLPEEIYVGLVAAAGQNGRIATATIDEVRLPRDCGSPSGGPTDNPVATRYGETAYPWTDEIKWECVFNINDFPGVTDQERYDAALLAAIENGGGVIYFPAGTYTFSDDLYLADGVVIRGETPAMADAKSPGYAPPTKFVFPAYVPSFTGSGTPNNTAFKRILTLSPNTDSNLGIVNVDLNRAGITLKGDAAAGANRNIVVFGVRQNNVAEPDPGVPNTSFQNAWQRWSYRFTDNIGIQAFANVLVANNRLNDNPTDNYEQPNYVIEDTSQPVGSPGRLVTLTGPQAVFSYTDHYGISVNRSKAGGYSLAGTPATEPSLFREGIVIRDNWVFATMRVKIHASGRGLVIADNVLRDQWGKARWVDPTGRRLVGNSATLENRGIDWSGYDVTVAGNDVEVARHLLKTGPYLSVDGEGILIQECCGGTLVNGATIVDNRVNAYIGLYKMRDIVNVLIARNQVFRGPGADNIPLIYVAADTNAAPYSINQTVVEDNAVSGDILFRGNAGSGSGNAIRNNTNPDGNGAIVYSTETNVVISGNTGFPNVIPE